MNVSPFLKINKLYLLNICWASVLAVIWANLELAGVWTHVLVAGCLLSVSLV